MCISDEDSALVPREVSLVVDEIVNDSSVSITSGTLEIISSDTKEVVTLGGVSNTVEE